MAKLTIKRGSKTYFEIARWAWRRTTESGLDWGQFVLRSDGTVLRRVDGYREGNETYELSPRQREWKEFGSIGRKVTILRDEDKTYVKLAHAIEICERYFDAKHLEFRREETKAPQRLA